MRLMTILWDLAYPLKSSYMVIFPLDLSYRLRSQNLTRLYPPSIEAQALDSLRETMEMLKICNKIAARIQAGDNVPLKDLRYLMKHNIRAYQLAMASRKPKEAPKEWESAIPKEEQEREQLADPAVGQTDGVQASSGCESSSSMSSDSGSSGGIETGTSSGGM